MMRKVLALYTHLVIGVSDDSEALGIETDGFPNEDKMNVHLVNLIKDGNTEQFFTRTDAATSELLSRQVQTYIQQRF